MAVAGFTISKGNIVFPLASARHVVEWVTALGIMKTFPG